MENLYLFCGQEIYIANAMLEHAINALLETNEREFNLIELDENVNFDAFMSVINTYNLLLTKKWLW